MGYFNRLLRNGVPPEGRAFRSEKKQYEEELRPKENGCKRKKPEKEEVS